MKKEHSLKCVQYGVLLLCFVVASLVDFANATPEYARQTGFECTVCHIEGRAGGALTETGEHFLRNLKASGRQRSLSGTQRMVRLFMGYLHMLAAIMWFGTIMYVHILLKPSYASKGLPTGELRVGLISMNLVLITGIFLTIARIPSLEMLYTTQFGILLSIKIFLFLIMYGSAALVVVFIRPKLRKGMHSPVAELIASAITRDQLAHFDGREGRPAYIAYKGIVYNVTSGRLWKNGLHVMKHFAGNDLTDALKIAPHGEDKIFAMPQVGTLAKSAEKAKQPFHLSLFYFFAYMNLVMVFIITFVIALWRWW